MSGSTQSTQGTRSSFPVQVSPSVNIFETLTYNYSGDPALIRPGVRVVIPIGPRITTGWVTRTSSDYTGRVKNIIAVVGDDYLPGEPYMAFVTAVSGMYFTSVGTLLDSALPPKKKAIGSLYFDHNGKIEKLSKYSLKDLQTLSKNNVIHCFYSQQREPLTLETTRTGHEAGAAGEIKNTFIIGYNREDYYHEVIADCLGRGQSVLITVPDNLTAAYFGEKLENVDIYNSEIKPKEREQLWHDYCEKGKTGVVVGGLSAVLLPISNLGAVICERAGSTAYKRTYFSRYDIHLLARLRAEFEKVPLVEGFSTYTVQAFSSRSQVSVDDQRGERIPAENRMIKGGTRGIPDDFIELLSQYVHENKKVLIVLNKKESVNFLYCGKCKKLRRCPSCNGPIEVDEAFNIKCLRCGLEKKSHTQCPQCGEDLAIVESVSTASVKKNIKQRVAETGIMTLSAEGVKKEHMYSLMRRIEDSKIVISTPVILNPYFNNRFDAVIYFRPESYFNIDEYDAAEKIFSMVSELRELAKEGGTFDIFSTFHFHYSLKLINDEGGFFDRELKYREWFHLPPFSNVYHIEVKERDLRKLAKEMRAIYNKFKDSLRIKRIYLTGRKPYKGTYKGILEAHAQSEAVLNSGLLGKRHISIDLVLI